MIRQHVMSFRSIVFSLAATIATGWAASSALAQPMMGIGFLPSGSSSVAKGVSADGSTVVGQSGSEAFLWRPGTGMIGLGKLSSDGYSAAAGVSADGATVVGQSGRFDRQEAFIWTTATGMVGLGYLPGAFSPRSEAKAVSADGSTVVGWCSSGFNRQAVAWTADTGIVGLGFLPGAAWSYSEATGVSANGSTIVGWGYNADGTPEAFVWTAGTGMVGLGILNSQSYDSYANGISADGSTVVGSSGGAAFLWRSDTGMIAIDHLPFGAQYYHTAMGASADGSIVVGAGGSFFSSYEAVAWRPDAGAIGLGYLSDDYPYSEASAISADGTTIVGWSTHANGIQEAFVLLLQPPVTVTPAGSVIGNGIRKLSNGARDGGNYFSKVTVNAWFDDSGTAQGTISWQGDFFQPLPGGTGGPADPYILEVTDLLIEGNTAWVGGIVIASTGQHANGTYSVFKFTDNSGTGGVDLINDYPVDTGHYRVSE